jgi:recombination endonuclease VII
MSASTRDTDGELCGKWMPRKKTNCARRPNHRGECRTAAALADNRQRKIERRRGKTLANDPAARARWRLTHKLKRYGLAQEDFDLLLEIQGYACAMCHEPIEDDQPIFIDHDHACCKAEKRSCGQYMRGLLCLRRNTALGYIEVRRSGPCLPGRSACRIW